MKNLGIGLVIVGIITMLTTAYNYVTEKNIMYLGVLYSNKEVDHTVQWSPFAGGVLLILGLVILIFYKRKRV